MSALPVTVPLGLGQTPTSFASSLAAANGVPAMRDFCRHMDIRLDRLRGGDRHNLDRLAELGNVDPTHLASGWIVNNKGVKFVGREKLQARSIVRGFRFCPACLREDVLNRDGPICSKPFLRAVWSVDVVETCMVHGTALVCSSRQVHPYLSDDFAAYIRTDGDEIEALAETAEPLSISEADRWMHGRLTGHLDEGFLDSLHFYVAVRLCEMIGIVSLFGLKAVPGKLTASDLRAARNKGYEVASRGVDDIQAFLGTLDTQFWKTAHATGGMMLYGPLYAWLQANIGNPDCDPVRELVRNHAIDSLPIGPGHDFLGKVEKRRWHSVHSVAKEYRLHPKRLRKVLAEKGIIGPNHVGRPDHRVVFEAASAADYLEDLKKCIPTPVARGLLNVSNTVFKKIVAAGFVTPIDGTRNTGDIRPHYSRTEIDRLLERLLADIPEYKFNDRDMVQVSVAVSSAGCTTIEVIRLLSEGKLEKVAMNPIETGLAALLVSRTEIRKKTVLPDHGGLSLREVEKELRTTWATVDDLVQYGILPSHLVVNPVKRCPQRVVMPEDLAAFTERYISLYELAGQRNVQIAVLRRQLNQAGVAQAFNLGCTTARFYERATLTNFV